MTLSIGPATDRLYGFAQQAVVGITVNGKPMQASDGQSQTPVFGMFVIGVTEPEGDSNTIATRTYEGQGLGQQQFLEDYVIPCYIDVRVSGGVQKIARDLAETAFNNFWVLLKADKTLGGALTGGRYAEISDLTESPMTAGTAAEKGRRHLIRFGVHCRNLTT